MNEEQKKMVEETTKSVVEAVEKAIPEVVDTVVSKKVEELSAKTGAEIEDVKAELKKMSLSMKQTTETKKIANKTAIVSIFKEVVSKKITTDKAFDEVVDATMKAMTEGTATEGAELVFDQFEADVLQVLNTYDIIKDLKIIPIAKGDTVKWPKVTNGVTTAYVDEADSATESKPTTAMVTLNIKKIGSLVSFSQELFDDQMTIPDLYNLIVANIGESQAEFIEEAILTGTQAGGGVEGVLNNAGVNKIYLGASNTAEDIDDDTIVDVVTKAARKFKRGNVKWYMSQYVYGKLRRLKTTDGYPLFPSLRDANPTLEGKAVVLSDVGFVQNSTEDIAAGICLLYGDLQYYLLARRSGLTVESGYYGDGWANDVISMKAKQRVAGKASFAEAFTIVVNGASA